MDTVNTDVLILGGGLAGLSAAYHLGTCDWRLIEAESTVGGLARTDVVDGFSFDWTGHWFHARDPQMRARIEQEWLPGNLVTVERRAIIYSQNVVTRFPYQINMHGLPPETVSQCVLGFMEANFGEGGRALRDRPPANSAEFALRHLGRGICERFLFPYNTKLFTVPPEELSAEWGGRFVPRPSLTQVVRGALGLEDDGAGYNATFWYPREGGIESLPRALASRLNKNCVHTGRRVTAIDPARREVRLDDGASIHYRSLISTLPLKRLCELWSAPTDALRAAAEKLRSVSVTTVELGVRGSPKRSFHWCYFPESTLPFYRAGSPSQVHTSLAPQGTHSFAVEFSHRGPVDGASLVRQAIEGLAANGFLEAKEVVLARSRTIPTAYVLFDQAYAEARKTVLDAAARAGIALAGRYGLWEYSSMEDALLTGRTAALNILSSRAA